MTANVWHSNNFTYGTITAAGVVTNGATNLIAPGQGLLIRKTSALNPTTAITFDNTVRVNATNVKYVREAAPRFEEMVRLTLNGNGYADEAVVYTQAGATNQIDGFDGFKAHSIVKAVPSLYSLANGEELSVNAQAATTADRVIPMGIRSIVAGKFTINATDVSNFSADKIVTLVDRKLGRSINLSTDAAYTFDATEGVDNNRFEIRITTARNANSVVAPTTIYSVGQEVRVAFANKDAIATDITVVDGLGRVVKSISNNADLAVNFVVETTPGIYFVKVQGPQGEVTSRVYLSK
jgi:hypothetical protein